MRAWPIMHVDVREGDCREEEACICTSYWQCGLGGRDVPQQTMRFGFDSYFMVKQRRVTSTSFCLC